MFLHWSHCYFVIGQWFFQNGDTAIFKKPDVSDDYDLGWYPLSHDYLGNPLFRKWPVKLQMTPVYVSLYALLEFYRL